MRAKFSAVFNIAIAGGAIGIVFADSIPEYQSWGGEFLIGAITTFVALSVMASISDLSQLNRRSHTNASVQKLSELVEMQAYLNQQISSELASLQSSDSSASQSNKEGTQLEIFID